MPLSYELLRVIWWMLLGVLLIGFAVMDGFDLGVAMWMPWLGRTDLERRIILRSIVPTWEGNQVWFILGGGAIFAAWPVLYALSFSGFYFAMFMVLLALILRPVGFKYRSKLSNARWRTAWDIALFIGGFVPALIFGVALGNVLQGVPFHFDADLRSYYTGSFWALLNPFACFTGVISVLMLAMHGAFYLQLKTEGIILSRARKAAKITAYLLSAAFAVAGFWLYHIEGYALVSLLLPDGPSNPLAKTVIKELYAWFLNYVNYPFLLIFPILGLVAPLLASLTAIRPLIAWFLSALGVTGIIASVGVSMFPFLLPSSSNPSQSLLVWDSSSSQVTLTIMLGAVIVFFPIILAYTAWVYRVMRGPITEEIIHSEEGY